MLEERVLLSSDPILMPGNTPGITSADQVLYYYGNLPNEINTQYEKTLTISNNSDQTIYPFLEGKNSRTPDPSDPMTAQSSAPARSDPYDPANQEYRGYIGYTQNGVTYAGLPANSSITVVVPIAFWDGGRVNFATDGADQFQTATDGASAGASFFFHDNNLQASYFAYVDPAHLDRLYFQPIYTTFDNTSKHMPSSLQWHMPTDLTNGMLVTGAGLPASGLTITLVPIKTMCSCRRTPPAGNPSSNTRFPT